PGAKDDLAVDHREDHRERRKVVRVAVDRILGQDRQVGTEAWADAAEPVIVAADVRSAGGVALQGGETVQRLVVIGSARALAGWPAQSRAGEALARIEARDRPIGAE